MSYEDFFAARDARMKLDQRTAIRSALEVNPEQAAQHKRDAAILGVAPGVVAADPTAARDAQAKRVELDLAGAPSLSRSMLRPEFAALAHDDTGVLKTVEGYVANFTRELLGANDRGQSVVRAAPAGLIGDFSKGLYQMAGAAADVGAQALDPLARLTNANNPLRQISDAMRGGAQASQVTSEAIAAPLERGGRDDTIISRSLDSAARSVGQTLAPLGAAAAGGKAVGTAALTVQSLSAGGDAAVKAKEAGRAPLVALGAGLADAAFEQAGNLVGFHRLLSDTVRQTGIFKTAARQIVPEVVGENATTALQDFNAWATVESNQGKTLGDYLAERPAAAAETTLAALFGAGANAAMARPLGVAAARLAGEQQQAATATEDANKLIALMGAAAQSKLRTRDADTFAQLVQQAAEDNPGAPAQLYVDAATLLGDGAKQKGIVTREQLAQLVPSLSSEQIDEAIQTGGAVELPIGEVAARVAGSPLEQALLDHVRTSPEGLSRAEAKQVSEQIGDMQALAEKTVRESSEAVQFEQEREQLRTKLTAQLDATGRMTSDVSKVNAQVAADFFTTMAARTGGTPAQMYAKYPLRITGASAPGGLAQGARGWFSGSTTRGLTRLSAGEARDGNLYGPGVYVARNRADAETYARAPLNKDGSRGAGGSVYSTAFEPVKPFDTAVPANATRYEKLAAEVGKAKANETLKAEGYDAILFKLTKGREAAVLLNDQDVTEDTSSNAAPTAPNFDTSGLTLAQGGPAARGTFSPDALQISLLEKADLSTFLHEMGHFGLELLNDLASQPNAPKQIVDDMAALHKWFGTTPEQWSAMTLDEKRPHHEKFAESFEAYLFEGKAPSHELQSAFVKLRSWFVSVYKTLTNITGAKLTPSVRGVFDRLLATDEAIAEAQDAAAYAPLFKDAAAAGMTPEQFDAYNALGQRATDNATSALNARSLRDMRWTANAHKRALRDEQARVEGLRKETAAAIRAELKAAPVERARKAIREVQRQQRETDKAAAAAHKEWRAAYKLAAQEVKENTPEADREAAMLNWEVRNPAPQPVVALPVLEAVAEQTGFTSADAMQRALDATPPLEQELEGRVDRRLLEAYGDTVTAAGMRRAADEAVHNEARTRFIATGLRALTDGRAGVSVLTRAAKQYAAQLVDGKTIRSLSVAKFKAAEVRAGKAALTAVAANDTPRALAETRAQLLNNQLVRAATESLAEIDKDVKKLRAILDKKKDEAHDQNMADLGRAILSNYGMAEADKTAVDYLAKVATYDPGLHADLLVLAAGLPAPVADHRDLTVADFRMVADRVKAVWSLAASTRQITIDGKKVQLDTAAAELAARLTSRKKPVTVVGRNEKAERATRISGMRSALRRMEAWAEARDGGDQNGPFRRYIWQPISEAVTAYRKDKTRTITAFRDLLKSIEDTLTVGKIDAPELGEGQVFADRSAFLHALLHAGNESNKRKLLLGYKWAEERADGSLDTTKWDAFLARMHAEGKLTKRDWDFAQSVWDLLNSTKHAAQAAHMNMYGRYFDEVTAAPVQTPFGEYRGGYVPAVTDRNLVTEARGQDAQADLLSGNNSPMFPAVGKGFTKGRVEDYTKPLALDLLQFPLHLDKVAKFSHMGPALRDVARLTTLNKTFTSAMTAHDATAIDSLIRPWLQRSASQTLTEAPQSAAGRFVASIATPLRTRTGLAMMAANVVNVLQQVTGFSVALLRVKPQHLAHGLWSVVTAPKQTAADIDGLSDWMAQRTSNSQHDVEQAVEQMVTNPNAFKNAQNFSTNYSYVLQQVAQNIIDRAVWVGAHDQALAAGRNERDAVRDADAAVRQALSSFAPEDAAGVESQSAFGRLFLQFYSYFSGQFNALETERQNAKGSAARLAFVYLVGFAVPAILADAISKAIRGTGDEDDETTIALGVIFGSQLRYALASIPFVGQLGNLVIGQVTPEKYDDKISVSPVASQLEAAARAPFSVAKAFDGENPKNAVKDTLTAISLLTGINVAVLAKPLSHLVDTDAGEVTARGLLTGRPPAQ